MMKILGRSFFLFAAILTFGFASNVSASVDNQNINNGDVVTLRLEAQGKDINFPLIDSISNCNIVNSSKYKSTNLGLNNGVPFLNTTEILELSFFPDKSLTVPSFSVEINGKMYKTKPIKINVNTLPNTFAPPTNSDISLVISATKNTVYQKEPLIVSLFLSKQKDIQLDILDFKKPRFNGFLAKQIGNERTFLKGNREVTQIDYELVPQNSGNLLIEPAKADIVAIGLSGNIFEKILSTPKHITISSNSLSIKVKQIPKDIDLVGDFNITSSVSNTMSKPNKPVIYTLSIKGYGYLDDFDGISFGDNNNSWHSQKQKILNNINNNFESSFLQDYVFVNDKDFTIPQITLKVFDTKNSVIKNVVLPPIYVKINGSSDIKNNIFTSKNLHTNINTDTITLIFLGFLCGILLILTILYIVYFATKRHKGDKTDALNILMPYVGTDKEAEEMIDKLYAQKNGDKSVKVDKNKLKELLNKYKKA